LRTMDGACIAYNSEYEVYPGIGAAGVTELVNSGYLKKKPSCPSDKTKAYEVTSGATVETSCMAGVANHTL